MKRLSLVLLVLLAVSSVSFGCVTLVPAINAFDVSPNAINTGGSATLIWSVSGVNSVNIDPGLGTLPAAGTLPVNPIITTAYTISASSPLGTVSKSVVLVVKPSPIAINVAANPAVLSSGGSATLQWNVTGADSVSIDQGIGSVPANGIQLVSPAQTTTYTLSASNAGGSVQRSTVVTVNPPIAADFNAAPATINIGQSATLTWNVTGADSVSIDQGIGQVPAAGYRTVTPNSTTSYTLTAMTSCCVISKAAVVTVGTVYPYEFQYGMMYGYPNDNNGYNPYTGMYGGMYGGTYGGMYGYPYGSPGGNQSLTPFIEIFNVAPNSIISGQPALLHWSVVGATNVSIGGIGSVPANGFRTIVPTSTTTYVLTASNAYSSNSKSVTLQVVP